MYNEPKFRTPDASDNSFRVKAIYLPIKTSELR